MFRTAGAGQSPLEKARELVAKGARKEAEVLLRQIIAADPNGADAHRLLGEELALQGIRDKAAREEFEKAPELDANLAEAHVNLSLILAQANELVSGRRTLGPGHRIAGQQPSRGLFALSASKSLAQDQIQKSIAELQKAVQLPPNYAEAWSDVGGMRRLVLDHVGAVKALDRAVRSKAGRCVGSVSPRSVVPARWAGTQGGSAFEAGFAPRSP